MRMVSPRTDRPGMFRGDESRFVRVFQRQSCLIGAQAPSTELNFEGLVAFSQET